MLADNFCLRNRQFIFGAKRCKQYFNTINMKHIQLLFLTLILTGQLLFGQNTFNSKILDLLNEPLQTNQIYQANYDTILKLTKDENVSYKSKVVFEGMRENIEFEKGIYIKEPSMKFRLFKTFIPRQVAFYFDKNNLRKSVWFFDLKYIEAENMITEISKLVKRYDDYGARVSWYDNIAELTLHRDQEASRIKLKLLVNDSSLLKYYENLNLHFSLEFTMFEVQEKQKEIESVRPKTAHEKLESEIKENKHGRGNSTFTLTIAKLESLIKSNTTLQALEKQLGLWESYGMDNHLGYEWDDKTKGHTIPLFQIQYSSSQGKKYYTIRTEVSQKLSNKIKYIEVITILNGMQLAEFKKSLATSGYLINENLTEIFRKQTWQHKAKNLMLTIKANANGTYSIGIR